MDATSRTEALAATRKAIDGVDAELLALLNRRAGLSLEAGRIKRETAGADEAVAVYDPKRERELLDGLCAKNPGPLSGAQVRAIWSEILSSSRALQHPRKVAYLGPEGTFSYFAGVEFMGRSTGFMACPDFEAVFREVQDGECELGIVPLENSLQGTVGQNFDLFWRYDVMILAEFLSRIRHSLLSSSAALGEIRRVYSHPQPLAQCGRWLRENLPSAVLVPVESTAAAAVRAAHEPFSAAIGHASLGERPGLCALATGIEDDAVNWTRFVVVAAREAASAKRPNGADKTSFMFTLPDRVGALAAVLEALSDGGVNMRKLESRPLRGECWKYIFFADVESDLGAPEHEGLLERLRGLCLSFRLLGSYPAGARVDDGKKTGGGACA